MRIACSLAALWLGACAQNPPAPEPPKPPPKPEVPAVKKEADHITVQHVLISFKGSIPKPEVTRSKEEAKKLAAEIFDRARKGEDFAALAQKYSDDDPVGIYSMHNFDAPKQAADEYPRKGMVKAFGDTSFSLDVGGIGMAEYDPATSKYGWHIIKRLK